MRESRIVIAWLSLPPEELIATRAPRRINRPHSQGMGISVKDMTSTPSGWNVSGERRGASLGPARLERPPPGSASLRLSG